MGRGPLGHRDEGAFGSVHFRVSLHLPGECLLLGGGRFGVVGGKGVASLSEVAVVGVAAVELSTVNDDPAAGVDAAVFLAEFHVLHEDAGVGTHWEWGLAHTKTLAEFLGRHNDFLSNCQFVQFGFWFDLHQGVNPCSGIDIPSGWVGPGWDGLFGTTGLDLHSSCSFPTLPLWVMSPGPPAACLVAARREVQNRGDSWLETPSKLLIQRPLLHLKWHHPLEWPFHNIPNRQCS